MADSFGSDASFSPKIKTERRMYCRTHGYVMSSSSVCPTCVQLLAERANRAKKRIKAASHRARDGA